MKNKSSLLVSKKKTSLKDLNRNREFRDFRKKLIGTDTHLHL